MSDEQFRQYIQAFHQQMAVLQTYLMQLSPPQQQHGFEVLEEIAATLGNLQIIHEEMQTSLEALATVESGLLEHNQQAVGELQYYHDLFRFCPDAYLVTDVNGLILEANSALSRLLNVPQSYLIRKPFAIFVATSDRQAFRTQLNQLSQGSDIQTWEINLRPKYRESFPVKLKVAIVRDDSGLIEALQIGVHDISEYKQVTTQNAPNQAEDTTSFTLAVPQSLDGLQVLVVEDEADAREFITAVLESHGIRAIAVASAAAALKALEQFSFDVLVSDIRMPNQDGYSLIRKVREIEAKQGRHIPVAALTAYLAEDREKVLAAGFESHLHKLAQPAELIKMVTRLAASRAAK